jgi:glycerate kinase
MKIVVAPDSFKGCMTSEEAGTIIGAAFRAQLAKAEIVVIPMADGGEGTTDAVVRATGGELRSVTVTGPLGEAVTAAYGMLPDGKTAVMEMASASGIELVPAGGLDPMKATTYGTGELMRAAMDAGAREIILGIGGSATVDGGIGMAQALGFRLLTADGSECGRGGEALATIAAIDPEGAFPALRECRVRVACDVTNPLLGERGAARVFGPQKGATPEIAEELERGLGHLAELWKSHGMIDRVDRPGDGAAGGLGAALRAFCAAEIASGAALVAEITGFDEEIRTADILVTGEGTTDEQTAGGKLCSVLAAKAKVAGAKTVLISGAIRGDVSAFAGSFDWMYATIDESVSFEEAVKGGRTNLANTARSVARLVAMGETFHAD